MEQTLLRLKRRYENNPVQSILVHFLCVIIVTRCQMLPKFFEWYNFCYALDHIFDVKQWNWTGLQASYISGHTPERFCTGAAVTLQKLW